MAHTKSAPPLDAGRKHVESVSSTFVDTSSKDGASPSESSVSIEYAKGGGSEVAFSSHPDLAEHYAPIAEYEGRHRYDPNAVWTEAEEKRIVRRIDKRICTFACLMFFALQLDRGNIVQALSDNMLGDLGISTNDYNTGQTIFYLSFLFAELPSQLISKKLGPDNWIPIQMICWSIVACCQAKLSGKGSFFATRCLLGLIEGGFIPDVILYLSYFYKTKELPIRLSFFWTAYMGTNIVAAFMAFGILRLRGIHGLEGWRWLFALEGALTALIGVFSWIYLPPSPTQTASWFRGKDGWFTEREEIIMVNRILRDDPSKGDMHNRQGLTPRLLWNALKDYDLWPIYLIGLTWAIPSAPMGAYLTLTLRSMGFDTFKTNLLTIPASSLFIVLLITMTYLSEKLPWGRLNWGIFSQFWGLGPLIALTVIGADTPKWGRYAAVILLVGHPYPHAIQVALTSRNAGSVRTRTVGSALYNMFVQASNIIASNIYREDDKPLYRRGNKALIGIAVFNIALYQATKMWYWWRNKKRDEIWGKMSHEEKVHYLKTTKDEGNKRLDFRFSY